MVLVCSGQLGQRGLPMDLGPGVVPGDPWVFDCMAGVWALLNSFYAAEDC